MTAFAPQLVAWRVLYGSWWVVPQGPGFMRWDAPCWSEVLFSSRNGLLPWSPAYAVFAMALVAGVRARPRLVGFLIAGVALQVVANGAVWDWWGGGSFGGRRFDSAYIAFALGAAQLATWIARVVPAAWASWRTRLVGAVAVATGVLVGWLTVVNLELVAETTATSARIAGGVPARAVLAQQPGGAIAGWVSSLVNLPARAMFAWRHDASLGDYDRSVGVFVLGETYPGLNRSADQRTATLPAPALADGRVHLWIGLNRTGGLDVAIPLAGGAPGAASVTWNGRPVAPTFHTDDLIRGTNDLVITGATSIGAIRLTATPLAR